MEWKRDGLTVSTDRARLDRGAIHEFLRGSYWAKGIPREWLRIVRESIRTVLPRFSARRMLKEYVREMYSPALQQETISK